MQTVISMLRLLGWKARALFLAPPSNAAGALGNHLFFTLKPPANVIFALSDNVDDTQFVIDFSFTDLFAIARPTIAFDKYLTALRPFYVGSLTNLKHTIGVMCTAANGSLETQSMMIPPWRRAPFLGTCYSRAIYDSDASGRVPDVSADLIATSTKIAMRFATANQVLLIQLNFNLTDPNCCISPLTPTSPMDAYVFEKVPITPPNMRPVQQSGIQAALLSIGWGL
jgi:uncharacterized protein (TIGR01615 family)